MNGTKIPARRARKRYMLFIRMETNGVSSLMSDHGRSSGPRWGLLQLIAWGVLTASGFIGVFAHHGALALQVAVYRGALAVTEVVAVIPLWLFCRWLRKRPMTWLQRILATAGLCYPLGFLCNFVAWVGQQRVCGGSILHWLKDRDTVLAGIGGAPVVGFILIAWS